MRFLTGLLVSLAVFAADPPRIAGIPCTDLVLIAPPGATDVPAEGATGRLAAYPQGSCGEVTLQNNASWLRLERSAWPEYTWIAEPNPSDLPRSATFTMRMLSSGGQAELTFVQRPLCRVVPETPEIGAGQYGGNIWVPVTQTVRECTPGAVPQAPWVQAAGAPNGISVWVSPNFSTHERTTEIVVGDRTVRVRQGPSADPSETRSANSVWFGLYGWFHPFDPTASQITALIRDGRSDVGRQVAAAYRLSEFAPTLTDWQFWRDTITDGRLTLIDLVHSIRTSSSYRCRKAYSAEETCILSIIPLDFANPPENIPPGPAAFAAALLSQPGFSGEARVMADGYLAYVATLNRAPSSAESLEIRERLLLSPDYTPVVQTLLDRPERRALIE